MTWKIHYAGLSDKGRVRAENEDHWLADPEHAIYIVADGIGGHRAGEVASRAVTETLPLLLLNRRNAITTASDKTHGTIMQEAITELSVRLYQMSRGQPGLDGMGATVVAVWIGDRTAWIGHMGDSRAYRLRGGSFEQLTKDHSLVQILVDQNELRPEEAVDHPARGQITRFVGMAGEPIPEVRTVDLCTGDRLMLCSDGLTNMLSGETILSLLQAAGSPKSACQNLIDAGNNAGGTDNMTALVIILEDIGPTTIQTRPSVQHNGLN